MLRWSRRILLVALLTPAMLVPAISAQESEKGARAYKGRLPNGWSTLNLTDEQKKEIYAAQIAARPKILKLEQELEKLRNELREKLRMVLTDEQRAELAKREAARKRRTTTREKNSE